MTQDQATPNSGEVKPLYQKALAESHYALLGLHPSASAREIRQSYRDLSKLYHPDTTNLPTAIATVKFQQLNEAYATLTNPERRTAYDRKIGYSSVPVVHPLPSLKRSVGQNRANQSSSAYLDATDRPLSPGEIFALFILGITFIGCLCLAIAIGFTRGETLLQPTSTQNDPVQQMVSSPATSRSAARLNLFPTHESTAINKSFTPNQPPETTQPPVEPALDAPLTTFIPTDKSFPTNQLLENQPVVEDSEDRYEKVTKNNSAVVPSQQRTVELPEASGLQS